MQSNFPTLAPVKLHVYYIDRVGTDFESAIQLQYSYLGLRAETDQ